VDQARFRAGFDFLRLRADAGEVPDELSTWWEEFSLVDESGREDLVRQLREEQRHQPRAVRTVRAPVSPATPAAPGPDSSEPAALVAEGDAPRKRRRRRRKPSGAGEPDGSSSE